MALVLRYDGTTLNEFRAVSQIPYSNTWTSFAWMWRGSISQFPSGFPTILSVMPSAADFIQCGGTNGNLVLRLPTQNGTRQVTLDNRTGLYSANETITIFAVWNGSQIQFYFNGSVLGSEVADSGPMDSASRRLEISGINILDHTVTHNDFALWSNGVPTPSEIASYPENDITNFTNQPFLRYRPNGDGSIVNSVSSDIGNNTLNQVSGPTSGTYAPITTAAEVFETAARISITSIKNISVTGSSVIFVPSAKNGQASVAIAGTYTGADITGIEVQVEGGNFRAVTNLSASGGSFTATAIFDEGEGLVYRVTGEAETKEITDFACGDLFFSSGQSNSFGYIGEGVGNTLPSEHIVGSKIYRVDPLTGVFTKYPAPQRDYHYTYALALLSRYSKKPICFISLAVSGSNIASWQDGGTSYNSVTAKLTNLGLVNDGSYKRTIWNQGEANSGSTVEQYAIALKDVYQTMADDWGIATMYVVPVLTNGDVDVTDNRPEQGAILACESTDGIEYAATWQDALHTDDSIHITSIFEGETLGARLSQKFLNDDFPKTIPTNKTITVSGAPNGTHLLHICDSETGDKKYHALTEFVGGSATVQVASLSVDTLKGFVDDNTTTNPVGGRIMISGG